MKKSILFLSVALSFTACAPRDTDPLSKEDHDKISGKSGGFSADAPGKARLPQKMELGIGVVAEGRILQAQQILNLASELAASGSDGEVKGCVRAVNTDANGANRTYQISYNNLCQTKTDAFKATLSGLATLNLQVEGNQLTALTYSTHDISDTDMDVMTIQAFKNGAKDTLFIKEAVHLNMQRKQGTDGYILRGNVQSTVQTGFRDTLTNIHLSNSFDGALTTTEVAAWHSETRGEAQNVTSTNPTPSTFILILDNAAPSAPSFYSFQMGNTTRKGKLVFGDNDVTAISMNDRTKSEDKVTVSRKKSTAPETVLPWDFWF